MNDLKPNTSRSDSRTDVLLPRNMRHHESDPLETNGKDGRKPGVTLKFALAEGSVQGRGRDHSISSTAAT